jgi:hypothetical protein
MPINTSSQPGRKLPAPKGTGVSELHQCQWIRGCMFTTGRLYAESEIRQTHFENSKWSMPDLSKLEGFDFL